MKRVFIVILVVFALLYLAALAVGFHMNARKAPSSVSATADNWVAWATGWLFGFGPRLDLSRLNCDGQPADREITLTQAKTSCVMRIPGVGADGPKYRKASVKVVGGGADAYILAEFDEKRFACEDRDRSKCFLEGMVPSGLNLRVRFGPDAQQKDATRSCPPREPNGKTWSCWLHKPPKEAVDLVALKEGGTLTLTCEGCCEHCDPRGPRVLQLRME
jgi:hypothetical protein